MRLGTQGAEAPFFLPPQGGFAQATLGHLFPETVLPLSRIAV